jgi:DNA-binding CsgD family transcriptional regulator
VTTALGELAPDERELLQAYVRNPSLPVVADEMNWDVPKTRRMLAGLCGLDIARARTLLGDAPSTEVAEPERREPVPALTVNELAVLRLAAAGAHRKEIAAELSLRESSVDTYMSTARRKLGAPNSEAAIRKAIQLGLIPDAVLEALAAEPDPDPVPDPIPADIPAAREPADVAPAATSDRVLVTNTQTIRIRTTARTLTVRDIREFVAAMNEHRIPGDVAVVLTGTKPGSVLAVEHLVTLQHDPATQIA